MGPGPCETSLWVVCRSLVTAGKKKEEIISANCGVSGSCVREINCWLINLLVFWYMELLFQMEMRREWGCTDQLRRSWPVIGFGRSRLDCGPAPSRLIWESSGARRISVSLYHMSLKHRADQEVYVRLVLVCQLIAVVNRNFNRYPEEKHTFMDYSLWSECTSHRGYSKMYASLWVL